MYWEYNRKFRVDENRYSNLILFYVYVFLNASLSNIFSFRCNDCIEDNCEHCYHTPVGDAQSIATLEQELKVQLDAYLANCGISFAEIKNKSKIIYDPCDLTRESNKYNIDFIPHGDTEEERLESQAFYNQLLSNELQLRTLEDRHNRLYN